MALIGRLYSIAFIGQFYSIYWILRAPGTEIWFITCLWFTSVCYSVFPKSSAPLWASFIAFTGYCGLQALKYGWSPVCDWLMFAANLLLIGVCYGFFLMHLLDTAGSRHFGQYCLILPWSAGLCMAWPMVVWPMVVSGSWYPCAYINALCPWWPDPWWSDPWWSQDHGILVRILMHCALGSLTHGGLTHGGLRIMGSCCVYRTCVMFSW